MLGTGLTSSTRGVTKISSAVFWTAEAPLVSEYRWNPRKWNFPERNRIIAGMADRLVVVEAPHRSSAMSTRHALEAGKEVWAVPGRITEESAEGQTGSYSTAPIRWSQ